MKKVRKKNPHWEPPPKQVLTKAQTAGILARHLIPLFGVLFLGWSAAQFLLLSVFNTCFSIVSIGMVGITVSTRQEVGPSPNRMDMVAGWVFSIAIAVVGSLILTAMFGWVIAVLASFGTESVFDRSLFASAALMIVSTAPSLYRRYCDDLASGASEESRKQRDQPKIFALVLTAGVIFILSGYAGDFGSFALAFLAIAVTAIFIFSDLRPDVLRKLAPMSS